MAGADESGFTTWLNGKLVEPADAVVSVHDTGFTVGEGVFETLLVRHGRAFAVRRHLRRLRASAGVLGLELPGDDVLRGAIGEVLAADWRDDARLRITVTAGSGSGSGPGSSLAGGETVLVTAGAAPAWPPSADVVTFPTPVFERSVMAGVKSTSYAGYLVARRFAARRGASEAILGNSRKNLCEGAASNVFVVWEGKLITPPLAAGCLPGITRELVIELCRANGLEVAESDSPLARLADSEEVFLTSSTRCVHPVARVDARLVGRGPGEVAAKAAAWLDELIAAEPEP